MLPLPLIVVFGTARRLYGSVPVATGAAAVPLAIPQLVHIGAAVNNDNLLTLLVGLMTIAALAAVITAPRSSRVAIAVGVLGGLALLTKGFALFIPAWVAGAYALAMVRFADRRRLLRSGSDRARPHDGARRLVVGPKPRRVRRDPAGHPAATGPDGVRARPSRGGSGGSRGTMTITFWSPVQGPGDPALPLWLSVIAMAVLLIGVAAAFFRRDDAGSRRWADAMVLAIPALGIACIVAQGAYAEYARSSLTPGLQGRYLFPAVAGLSVLCAAGLSVLSRGRDRLLAGLVLSAAALIQVSIGIATLRAYWESPDQPSLWQGIRAVLAWSPWPSPIVMVVWASLVLAIGVLAREALRFTRENETTVD